MSNYFKNVPKVAYEGPKSTNPFSFKYYDKDKVINGKTMQEHLKFAMSWWHTICADGSDPFGEPTIDRRYGTDDEMQRAKNKVDAAFDFMDKLGIEYFCFHDVDIAPRGETFKETKENLEEIVKYIKEKKKDTNIKLLWATTNAFSNRIFMHGAGTSPYADAFALAAAQVKNAIDATIELGGRDRKSVV